MEVVAALLGLGAVLCVVGFIGLYLSRQRTLSRRVASFDCLVHLGPRADGPWQPGIAQYGHDRLLWWQTLSLSPRPAFVWWRSELDLVERRPVGQNDEQGRPLVVVECRHRGEEFQVMISTPAYTGLVSWLESGPRRAGRVL